jgi:hypothetical protein
MLFVDAHVRSRWFAVDAGYFSRHSDRRFRLRGLYPNERVLLDAAGHEETPPRGSSVLKIVTRKSQALKVFDKAEIVAALDTQERIEAAWDLLAVGDVHLADVFALARARASGRLQ